MDEPEISVNFSIEYRADDELDPYQMRLYVHLARVCSETDNGACNESTEALAAACQMSAGMVVKVKNVLADLGFIHVETGKGKRADAVLLCSPHDMLEPSVSPHEQEATSVHRSISQDERNTSSMSPRERYEPSVHHMNARASHVHEGARAVTSSFSTSSTLKDKDLKAKDKDTTTPLTPQTEKERGVGGVETSMPRVVELYEQVTGQSLKPLTADTLRDDAKTYPLERIEEAARLTMLAGKTSWRYTQAILKNADTPTNGKARASPAAVVPRTRHPSLNGFDANAMIAKMAAEGTLNPGWNPFENEEDDHAEKPAATHF